MIELLFRDWNAVALAAQRLVRLRNEAQRVSTRSMRRANR
jgi:hypothetical protein